MFQQSLSYYPIWVWDSDRINFAGIYRLNKFILSKAQVLDMINPNNGQNSFHGQKEFILFKTRVSGIFGFDPLYRIPG